jgi:hypothetical protein
LFAEEDLPLNAPFGMDLDAIDDLVQGVADATLSGPP